GYVFDKWTITGVTVDETQSTVTFTMPANDVTATATYKNDPQQPTTYTVTVTNGSGGGSYAEGESVTITADAPQSGYVFDKWTITGVTVDETQSTVSFTMPANDVTATATYKTAPQPPQSTYDITVDKASLSFTGVYGSYGDVQAQTVTVTNIGTASVDLKISLNTEGFDIFDLFKGSDLNTSYNVIDVLGTGIAPGGTYTFSVKPENRTVGTYEATITVTAVDGDVSLDMETIYPVTFTVTPAQTPQPSQHNVAITGSYAQNSGAGSYAVGDIVNIDAGSRSGYEFIGWVINSGNVTLADDDATATSFTMGDEDVSLTAKWLKKSSSAGGSNYKIVVEEADDGSVAANRKSAPKGATVIITVEPDKGFELDEVTVVDKRGREVELKDKGDGRFSFKMPARDVTVSAKFSEKEQVNPFTDISEEDAYYDAVLWAVENGVTSGFSATTFAPYGPCTRAQMMTFLWRSIGRPAPSSTEHPFTDIKDDYYFEAVLWAVEEGITVGTTPTTFGPDEPCTRAQMATFLFRLVGDEAEEPAGRYADVLLHKYYALPVEWAAENGYIDGISEELFAPEDVCTRATMVTALYRLANK
ncbi:MAG: S-layer homology domain-containing protein, partial [Firmicutes bacterium]|nr:S-layer homology domain-containing protein [Bacillota bacterium]